MVCAILLSYLTEFRESTHFVKPQEKKLAWINHFLRSNPCVCELIRPFLHPNNQIALDIQEGKARSIAPALYLRKVYNRYGIKNIRA